MTAVLHAEWTKFRTVRGWVIGMLLAVLVTLGVGLLGHDSCSSNGAACPALPLGPGGEAVTDAFYFVHQPLAADGSITVRVTSLTGLIPNASSSGRIPAGQGGTADMHSGLKPWSKAGIIIKANTDQGSMYAAMMVTGSHGVRMQWDFTQDTAGMVGAVSAASPRWLRLTRSGDTITGYDSADGRHWTNVGTATLAGLPTIVQAGLFAASTAYSAVVSQSLGGSTGTGGPTLATGNFDHVDLAGAWRSSGWSGEQLDGGPNGTYPTAVGGFHRADGGLAVTGSGDIAPDVPGAGGGASLSNTLIGTFAGLIPVVVVAAMFITAEYRRGLIRVTLSATPRRGRALAGKALVIGAVTFAAGLVAAVIAVPLGEQSLRAGGVFVDPVGTPTLLRMTVGTAALLAVAAVLALAIGTIVRRSAVAVTIAVVVIVLPYLLSTLLSGGAALWLLRVTPAAAFAIQQPYPAYPQVSASYTAVDGYYPLAPWAGLAVLCCWAAAALGIAFVLLRRRDA